MKVQLLAGALGVSVLAGCSTVNLVRPSKPHGTLVVKVEHGPKTDGMFEDVVLVDGLEYPIGSGKGGELTVLVSPGKHDVRLVSLRQEQQLQIYDVRTSTIDVFAWGQGNVALPVTRVEPTMQLGAAPVASCKHAIDIDAQAGQTVRASLLYDGDDTCDPEGT